MKTLKKIALIAMAVAVSAAPALAGTKYAANLVPSDVVDPPIPPTLSSKSSLKLSDKGAVQVGLAGVVEAGPSFCAGGGNDSASCTNNTECPGGACTPSGVPVTSSTAYNDTGTLDGTEYVAIIKLSVTAVAGLFPVIELPIPLDLKGGKGKAKFSAASLFGLISPPNARTVEIVGTEVWGPLGAGAGACQAIIDQSIPVIFPPDMSCRSGNKIGISGLQIPNP